ncbi:MAG: MoxR family ATPase [Holophagales bacterium]|nr:MoxR family ATPase [Holophagales bacterium]
MAFLREETPAPDQSPSPSEVPAEAPPDAAPSDAAPGEPAEPGAGSSGDAPAPQPSDEQLARALDGLPALVRQVHGQAERVILGQRDAVDALIYALLSRGHCLLVGVPGVGKTLLVRTFARLMGLPFGRIQFTPDLMPSDVTGTEILEEDVATGHRAFLFAPGPIFTQVLLADEINRTPPKTQAALLEAMQEKTVTVAGKEHRLDEPFLVLATQNPIEQEGTYPLPEAQLDRFLFQMGLGYPSAAEECRVVEMHSFTPLDDIEPILDRQALLELRLAVARVPAAPEVVEYAVRLARASRPEDPSAPDFVRAWLRFGASPRATQQLIVAGRARAACQGRFNVAREDVKALAPWILRHRLIRSFDAEADGQSTEAIVERLLETVPESA